MANKKRTIWSFDCETDPFLFGRGPVPFAWGAISEDGERVCFWGDDSTEKFIAWVYSLKNCLLLGHNAGKFDALFLKPAIAGHIMLVDGRIIKCKIGDCEIRDSFAIFPMALSKLRKGGKKEIDYKKLERENREENKQEIISYMMQDCQVLLDSVLDFYARSGRRPLTIASQASRELRECYPDLPKLNALHDAEFRPFFFGGRVQAFEKGIITGNFKSYDVNSMYPDRMAHCQHPYGAGYKIKDFCVKNLPDNGAGFFYGEGDSLGAFPIRQKDKTTPYLFGDSLPIVCTIHEVIAALKLGVAKNLRGKLLIPEFATDFSKFIIPHYEARLRAKAVGDEGADLYHKTIPNSSYGRFAMSPDGRDECYYAEHGENIEPMFAQGWRVADIDMEAERFILKRPTPRPWQFFEDVATGASITGAARAKLLYAIVKSKRTIYCDTDNVKCEEFYGVEDGKKLGGWKKECEFDTAAIAGKKMYVLLNHKRVVGKASKGVAACPTEIYQAAAGEVVEVVRDAPTMRLNKMDFVKRKISLT